MKAAFLLLLLFPLMMRAESPRGRSTILHLSPAQLDEFDLTRWVTLTAEQRQLLNQQAGVAPSRVQVEYHCPDGERAELGYNIALKISANRIEVLHRFLLSDEAAKKKCDANRRMVESVPASTKECPSFAIDSEGKLWQFIDSTQFERYIASHHQNISTMNFSLPSSMPSKNTVASDDALRRALKLAQAQSVPTYVISKAVVR